MQGGCITGIFSKVLLRWLYACFHSLSLHWQRLVFGIGKYFRVIRAAIRRDMPIVLPKVVTWSPVSFTDFSGPFAALLKILNFQMWMRFQNTVDISLLGDTCHIYGAHRKRLVLLSTTSIHHHITVPSY